MSESKELTARLQDAGLTIVGEICRDPEDASRHLVFVESYIDERGARCPSAKSLRKIAREVAIDELEFILVDAANEKEDEKEDIESDISMLLKRNFPTLYESLHIAFLSGGVVVWVETKREFSEAEVKAIKEKCKKLMELNKLRLASLRLISSSNLPTQTACLNALRRKSPATQNEIETLLTNLDFSVPDSKWLARVLDKLRKSGLVVWNGDGTFALTYAGLVSLGTLRNRRSPDVRRALDLARRDV